MFRIYRPPLFLTLLLATVAAIAASSPAQALPLNSSIVSERALLILGDDTTDIITQISVAGPDAPIVLLLPIPADAQIIPIADQNLFAALDTATQPAVITEELLVWRASDLSPTVVPPAPAPPATIEAAPTIAALRQALAARDRALPDAATSYYDAGMQIALVTAERPGILAPLGFRTGIAPDAFASALWPADSTHELQLYILGPHRVESAGMQSEYAGPVDALTPPLPRALGEAGAYLTRLARSAGGGAISITRAPDDAPLRATVTRTVYIDGWRRMAIPILALAIVAMSSMGAFSLALILRKRIDAIGESPRR